MLEIQLNELDRDILRTAQADWIGVWIAAGAAEAHEPDSSPDELRELVIASTRKLLRAQFLRAGDLMRAGFVPWTTSPDESADRINAKWLELGRVPNPPESAWFELTEAGREAVTGST